MIKSLITRIFICVVSYVVVAEVIAREMRQLNRSNIFHLLMTLLIKSVFQPYYNLRDRLLNHYVNIPLLPFDIRELYIWIIGLVVSVIVIVLAIRKAIQFWNRLLRRFEEKKTAPDYRIKPRRYSLAQGISETRRFPTGEPKSLFLGRDSKHAPFLFSPGDRTLQTQIIGKTGSGKSTLIEVMLCQDLAFGQGAIILDGKGELGFVETVYSIARRFGRESDFRFFSLAYSERSDGYNPLFIKRAQDVAPVSQRVFSVFDMDEPYFRQQAESFLFDLVSVFHGTGKIFTFKDLYRSMVTEKALENVAAQSSAREAVFRITKQMERLGKDAYRTLSGLESWLRKFASIEPLNLEHNKNSIVIEDIINNGRIAYFQLPGAFQQIFSTAVGKMVLQDIQMEIARRQLNHQERPYFPVYVDEFYNFAYPGFMDAINKGRSANLMWTLAHQSMADLERVSAEFAQGVWDNTRNKIILSQNNHELCEKISRDIGTFTTEERTFRETRGPLWTTRQTGEASKKKVDEFIFNPNRIKSLESHGQGYFINERHQVGLNFPYLGIEVEKGSLFSAFPRTKKATVEGSMLKLDQLWQATENYQPQLGGAKS